MAEHLTAREAAQAALDGRFPLTEQDLAYVRECVLEGHGAGPTNIARLLHHIAALEAAQRDRCEECISGHRLQDDPLDEGDRT